MNIDQHYRANYKNLVLKMKGRMQSLPVDLAEDIVQQAYCEVMRYFHTFDAQRGSFDDWFNSILNNVANKIKKEELDKGVVRDVKSDDAVITYATRAEKEPILKGFNEEKRHIIKLYIWEDFTYKEIGELVGCSHSKVRKTVSRFFKNIQMREADLILELT